MRQIVIMNVILGFILAIIAIPMILNRIKPNHFYGFRVKRTMENPEIWYQVNEFAGKQLFVAGIAIILLAIGLSLILNLDLQTYSLITPGINIALLLVALIRSVRYLNSLG
jgi:uncharacterized membrane protein